MHLFSKRFLKSRSLINRQISNCELKHSIFEILTNSNCIPTDDCWKWKISRISTGLSSSRCVSAIIKRRRRVMCVTINNQRLAFLFRANRMHTGLIMHMLIACLHTYHELARSRAQLWPCPAPVGMALPLSVRLEGPAEHNRRMQSRTKVVQSYNIADMICAVSPLVKMGFLDGFVFHQGSKGSLFCTVDAKHL